MRIEQEVLQQYFGCEIRNFEQKFDDDGNIVVEFTILPPKPAEWINLDFSLMGNGTLSAFPTP